MPAAAAPACCRRRAPIPIPASRASRRPLRASTASRGFMIVHGEPVGRLPCLWSTRITVPGGQLIELAGDTDPGLLANLLPNGERIEMADAARGSLRMAVLAKGRVKAA